MTTFFIILTLYFWFLPKELGRDIAKVVHAYEKHLMKLRKEDNE